MDTPIGLLTCPRAISCFVLCRPVHPEQLTTSWARAGCSLGECSLACVLRRGQGVPAGVGGASGGGRCQRGPGRTDAPGEGDACVTCGSRCEGIHCTQHSGCDAASWKRTEGCDVVCGRAHPAWVLPTVVGMSNPQPLPREAVDKNRFYGLQCGLCREHFPSLSVSTCFLNYHGLLPFNLN